MKRAARRRPLDLVARYGGEELIAVLYGADRAHAEAVARSVLDSIRELRIPHVGSLTRPYVTASVGTATCDPCGDHSHDIAVQLADRACTQPRRRGGDGWACHDPAASVQFSSVHPDNRLRTAS